MSKAKNKFSGLSAIANMQKIGLFSEALKDKMAAINAPLLGLELPKPFIPPLLSSEFLKGLNNPNLGELMKKQINFNASLGSLIAKNIQASTRFKSLAEELRKVYKKALDDLPDLIHLIHDEGWYLPSLLLPRDIIDINQALAKEDTLDHAMSKFYIERLMEYREWLMESYAERAPILDQAFEAHEQKKYFLSIPVLLAQTEGIYSKTVNEKLYNRQKTKSKIKRNFQDDQTFGSVIASSFGSSDFSLANSSQLSQTDFNRHKILHGSSLTYGTEINSLKSISFLIFISDLIRLFNKQK